MKDKIINKSIKIVKTYTCFNNDKIDNIRYGLEVLYLTISKIVVISFCSLFLHTLKELFLLFLFYGILRVFSFGLHAKKSIDCWISSLFFFLTFPHLITKVVIPIKFFKFSLSFFLILIFKYAPADTPKRPLLNQKKRIVYKLLTFIISLVYSIVILLSKNIYIQNLLFFSIFIQTILIIPLSYKIFGIEYNNYKKYEKKGG